MFEQMKQRRIERKRAEAEKRQKETEMREKAEAEKRRREAEIREKELAGRYKGTLPRLYDHLSRQQLSEAYECIQNILSTGQTYGNPVARRLVEIVNNFWYEPVSGQQVSLPHNLSYFRYDLEYISMLLERRR